MTTTMKKSSSHLLNQQSFISLRKSLEPCSVQSLKEMVDDLTSMYPADRPSAWMNSAACKGTNVPFVPPDEMSKGEKGYLVQLLKKEFCDTCPVKVECVANAMLEEEADVIGDQSTRHRFGLRGIAPLQREIARKWLNSLERRKVA